MEIRKIRILRRKFQISIKELAEASGVSFQRISRLELCDGGFEPETLRKIQKGMSAIFSKRNEECTELYEALRDNYDSLLEVVEESDYEL